nr:glycosyltransferase family 2 protein [uncultured Rhodopila sp.]
MPEKSFAAVTMTYNESHFMPIWAKYYGGLFGPENCYVIDHGSDDGSTSDLGGMNILRIPRSPKHNLKRANFISNFVSSLLEWHDTVLYTDIDEMLVPDPDVYTSLVDFCDRMQHPAVTAIGMNIHHVPEEPPIQEGYPVLEQRRWGRFLFSMCKPLVTRVPIKWVPGFHTANHPMVFDNLYLFHLHDYDDATTIRRLAMTRDMPWGDGPPDHYQRWPDEKYKAMLESICRFKRHDEVTLKADDPYIALRLDWARKFIAENPARAGHFYLAGNEMTYDLLRVPDRFTGIF